MHTKQKNIFSRSFSRKFRQFLIIFFFNIFIIVFFIYGFEYCLKLKDPMLKLPINGRIENKHYTWGNLVVSNEYGFRERDFDTLKPPNTYRIMVLGDSLTWGAGLALKQRYTDLTEKFLNEKNCSFRFEVLNFAIPGGPTVVERDILKEYKRLVDPDLIVLGFCINDPQPEGEDYTIEKENFNKKHRVLIDSIIKKLNCVGLVYTAKAFDKVIYKIAEKLGIIPTWIDGLRRPYSTSSEEWLDFEQALKDIKNMSDEMNLPPPVFTVLNQGLYTDRPTDYADPNEKLRNILELYRKAEKAAAKEGFKSCNHEKEIIAHLSGKILAVNIMDGHPSAELNSVYAKKLSEIIIESIGLPDNKNKIHN